MIGELPRSISVKGVNYRIRSDFRDVLKIISAFNDPDLKKEEQVYICLFILYEDFDSLPESDYEAAFKAAIAFLDHGVQDDGSKHPRVMDWEQDESILFPAINKVAGYEIRSAKYVHWWTFLGYFMEISDGVFATVLGLRTKKAKGKKLEKWEQEYWAANKSICTIKQKLSADEQAAKDKLLALLDG